MLLHALAKKKMLNRYIELIIIVFEENTKKLFPGSRGYRMSRESDQKCMVVRRRERGS